MTKRLCTGCGVEECLPRKQRCYECDLRRRPVTERVIARDYRLSLVPEEWRLARVPASDWPEGRRWCAGCQTFVLQLDVPKGGSQCRTCAGVASHLSMIKSTYGVDKDTYGRLMNLQGGRCAICRRFPKTKRLVMDHDHKTDAARGLLCTRCNHDLLGAAHDSIEILEAAVYYLRNPPLAGLWQQPEIRDGSMPHGQIPY